MKKLSGGSSHILTISTEYQSDDRSVAFLNRGLDGGGGGGGGGGGRSYVVIVGVGSDKHIDGYKVRAGK